MIFKIAQCSCIESICGRANLEHTVDLYTLRVSTIPQCGIV